MVKLLDWLTYTPIAVWMVNTGFINIAKAYGKLEQVKVIRWIHNELKPFIPYLILAQWLVNAMQPSKNPVVNALSAGLTLWLWHQFKDIDDDDRWKKRADKVAGVVKSLGHRLVVVNVKA